MEEIKKEYQRKQSLTPEEKQKEEEEKRKKEEDNKRPLDERVNEWLDKNKS